MIVGEKDSRLKENIWRVDKKGRSFTNILDVYSVNSSYQTKHFNLCEGWINCTSVVLELHDDQPKEIRLAVSVISS